MSPMLLLYPFNESLLSEIQTNLSNVPNVTVYVKNQIPAKWHFQNNIRIPPILVVSDIGYMMTAKGLHAPYTGNHGFDNDEPTMKAFFAARGPQFIKAMSINKNLSAEVDAFDNIHVYSMICSILGLKPAPNNGTLSAIQNLLKN